VSRIVARLALAVALAATSACALDGSGIQDGAAASSTSGVGGAGAAASAASSGGPVSSSVSSAVTSSSSSAGGAGGASGAGGAGGTGTRCALVVDDFDDGVLAQPPWTVSGIGSVVEAQQVLQLAPPASSNGYAIVETPLFDLTGCAIVVQLVEPLPAAPDRATTFKALGAGTSTWLRIGVSDGKIRFSIEVDGTNQDTTPDIPFDPATDVWLRIREDAGTVYFDTSGDGLSWTERLSGSTPPFVTSVTLQLQAVAYQSVAQPGVARFDNVNLPP